MRPDGRDGGELVDHNACRRLATHHGQQRNRRIIATRPVSRRNASDCGEVEARIAWRARGAYFKSAFVVRLGLRELPGCVRSCRSKVSPWIERLALLRPALGLLCRRRRPELPGTFLRWQGQQMSTLQRLSESAFLFPFRLAAGAAEVTVGMTRIACGSSFAPILREVCWRAVRTAGVNRRYRQPSEAELIASDLPCAMRHCPRQPDRTAGESPDLKD